MIPSNRPFNPYVGLRAFEAHESLLFFGRNEQTEALLKRLHQHHFIAVVGSSGSGKSSLVRAGMIPMLEGGFLIMDRDEWRVATFTPGNAPLQYLAAAILHLFGDSPNTEDVSAFVNAIERDGEDAIVAKLTPLLENTRRNLLLLADQFEELFRFCMTDNGAQAGERAAEFVSILLALAEQRTFPIYVVTTMRSDFIGDCNVFPGLPEAMNQSQYLVPQLTMRQTREAITGPANLYKRPIESELVDTLLMDIRQERDRLPILQHVLMRAWESKFSNGQLTLDSYRDVGGIQNALSNHAQQTLSNLDDSGHRLAEQIFRALTDTDPNGRQTRRPSNINELSRITQKSPEEITSVIKQFQSEGRSFLSTRPDPLGGDDLVDITHESLIRQWGKLQAWIRQEADKRDVYLRLADAAQRYDRDECLEGRDLEDALSWQKETSPTNSWSERYGGNFELAAELLKRSELQNSAESKRRRQMMMRLIYTGISGVFILLSLLLAWAISQSMAATANELNANYNLARMFAEKADAAKESYSKGDLQKSWLCTLAAMNQRIGSNRRLPISNSRYLNPEFRESLSDNRFSVSSEVGPILSVSFNLDGEQIASGSYDGTIRLWNVATGRETKILRGHEAEVYGIALSPDDKQIVSASADGTIRLWNLATGKTERVFVAGLMSVVFSVAFTPDGKHIVSGSEDGTVRLWNVATGNEEKVFRGHRDWVRSVAFSVDGTHVASGSDDATIRLWKVTTGEDVMVFRGHKDSVYSVVFSPDNKQISSGSGDGTVRLWNIATGKVENVFRSHDEFIYGVAFSPDGTRIASGTDDGTIRVWNKTTGKVENVFHGHIDVVFSVKFSPNGKRIVSGARDRAIRLWNLEGVEKPSIFQRNQSGFGSVSLSPEGTRVAAATGNNSVQIWDVAGTELARFDGPYLTTNHTLKLQAYKDRKEVYTSQAKQIGQSIVQLRNKQNEIATEHSPDQKDDSLKEVKDEIAELTTELELLEKLQQKLIDDLRREQLRESRFNALAFSSDGKRVAFAFWDNIVHVWDVELKKEIVAFEGHESAIKQMVFSPKGKRIASISGDNIARLWDIDANTEVPTLDTPMYYHVAFLSNGRAIALGAKDGYLGIWDFASGKQISHFNVLKGDVPNAEFDPHGEQIAFTFVTPKRKEGRCIIEIYNVYTGKMTSWLEGTVDSENKLTFSSDGKRIVSIEGMWDVATGQSLARFRRFDPTRASYGQVAYNQKSNIIAFASKDNTLRLWRLSNMDGYLKNGRDDPEFRKVYDYSFKLLPYKLNGFTLEKDPNKPLPEGFEHTGQSRLNIVDWILANAKDAPE